MNHKKKIIITGGAGFLGSHLSKQLLNLGHQVTILDNLYTGRKENIQNLLSHKNFTFIEHDIIKPIQITADVIFNLACPASPPHYQKDPIFTLKTNIIGTLNMLEEARKQNALFIQASTSEVYGDPEIHPQTEHYRGSVNPIGIRACYDEGKRSAETLCFDFHRHYRLPIRVMRIFNTYGPHMDPADGRVISNFIMQALHNKPITIYGDGTQTRSFCYVDDLIDGMVKLMTSAEWHTGPINLGNPDEYNLLELARLIIQLTKSHSKLAFKPLPQDDPCKRKPDITLAKTALNWQPSTSLPEGLVKTIDYFKNNKGL